MTVTEELRRMLDERGIEHDDYDPDPRYRRPTSDRKTEWDGASFREWPNGTIRFSAKGITPAQAIAATMGRPKVKKVRGMTYDEHGGEVYYLACSGCGEWIDGDLDCITEFDGPNFCHNCGGEFDGPLLCKRCGGLADFEYGDMCAKCYEEVGE